MNPLRQILADYLSVRRALGSKLDRAEKLLGQFVSFLEDRGATTVTVDDALAWATLPREASSWWWALRLSPVRGFATYLRTIDGIAQIPPPGILAHGSHRATPFLYSNADIRALVQAASELPHPASARTYPALISVLAVTGMRISEAISLDIGDFDDNIGVLTVRQAKFGKKRLLPLHPTTAASLARYLGQRRERGPAERASDALFASTTATRLDLRRVQKTFKRLTVQAGLAPRSATCRPRIHDLRHSFAVATLLDWYRRGDDVQALMPRLSTYLGHVDPKDTFWYLSAAPELLALAGQRLNSHLAGRP